MCILNVATSDTVYLTVLSSETCVTVATICGVWIVAEYFVFPKILSKYLCHESIILHRKIYDNFAVMLKLLLSCVIHLHHDGPPSCGNLMFCI